MPRQYIRDPANPLKWIPVGGGSGPSVITEHQAVVIRQPDASYVLQTSFAELSYAFSIQRPISLFVEIQSGVFQRFDLATHGINDDGEYFVFAQVILENQIATGTTIIIKNERGIISVSEVRAELNNPGVDSEITQDEVISALGYTPLSEETLSEFAKQVVLYAPQNELTGEQKAIARKNIGAIGLNSVIVFVANGGVLEAYTVSEDNGTLVGPMTGEEIKIAVSPSGGRYQVFVPNGDGLTEAKLIGEWDEEEKTCVFFHANRAPDGQSILVKIPLEETTGTYKDVPDANVDPTLSIDGMAADAAAVGAALSKISTQKVDVDQGEENAGKLLGIGTGGIVVPVDVLNAENAVVTVEELPEVTEESPKLVYLLNDKTGGESGGITEETDPTVPDWAKQPKKPTYTAEEVGALSKDTVIPTVPNALPNPHKLKFTGAVSAEYDGSSEVFVEIPEGSSGSGDDYTLPVASPETLGGVKPEVKSNEMTQPVGVDDLGALWTIPSASGGGRVIETLISDVITEEGVTTYQRNLTWDEVEKINNATFVRLTLNTNQSAVAVPGVNFYLWSNYANPLGSIGTINFGTGNNTQQIAMLTAELAEDRKSGLTCAVAELPGVNSHLNIVRFVSSVNDGAFRVHNNSNIYAKTTTETGFPVGTTFTLEVG